MWKTIVRKLKEICHVWGHFRGSYYWKEAFVCLFKGHDTQETGIFHFPDRDVIFTRFECKRCQEEFWQNSNGYTVPCPLDRYYYAPGDDELLGVE